MAGKRCAWCRKAVRWYHFEAGYLSSAVRVGAPIHLSCQAEREKYPAIAERQDERTARRRDVSEAATVSAALAVK